MLLDQCATVVQTQKIAIENQQKEIMLQYAALSEYKEQLEEEKKNNLKYKIGAGILAVIAISLAAK